MIANFFQILDRNKDPIISKLALAWFGQPECDRSAGELLWALQNVFTLPELALFFAQHQAAAEMAACQFNQQIADFGRQVLAGGEMPETLEHQVDQLLHARISELQMADRRHWREVIQRLKEMRSAGRLMLEGKEVLASDRET